MLRQCSVLFIYFLSLVFNFCLFELIEFCLFGQKPLLVFLNLCEVKRFKDLFFFSNNHIPKLFLFLFCSLLVILLFLEMDKLFVFPLLFEFLQHNLAFFLHFLLLLMLLVEVAGLPDEVLSHFQKLLLLLLSCQLIFLQFLLLLFSLAL